MTSEISRDCALRTSGLDRSCKSETRRCDTVAAAVEIEDLACSYPAVDLALDEIARLGAGGPSNDLDAMLVAMKALSEPEARSKSKSESESDAERLLVFTTDGMPTLPLEQSMHQTRRFAISAGESSSGASSSLAGLRRTRRLDAMMKATPRECAAPA